jgi:hypothetical protein
VTVPEETAQDVDYGDCQRYLDGPMRRALTSFSRRRRRRVRSRPATVATLRWPQSRHMLAPVQVIFAVNDLQRTLGFYESAFGWRRNDRIDFRNYAAEQPREVPLTRLAAAA